MSQVKELHNELDELQEMIEEVIRKAKHIGKISKDQSFSAQIEDYMVGTFKSFIDNEYQGGSIESLRGILDNEYEEDDK